MRDDVLRNVPPAEEEKKGRCPRKIGDRMADWWPPRRGLLTRLGLLARTRDLGKQPSRRRELHGTLKGCSGNQTALQERANGG